MVRAHSLLYAVYVCLIVSILCAALLYISTLYTTLNQFYNSREDLYLENQSVLNYALSIGDAENTVVNEENGISSGYQLKSHGLLKVAIVKSALKNDTVSSAHFIGHYADKQTALFLSGFSNPLSYSGKVTLIGNKNLPTKSIEVNFIHSTENKLISTGKIALSPSILPEINPEFKKAFEETNSPKLLLKDLERNKDSIYYNSFLNKTIEVQLPNASLQNVIIKGNFILYARDSILIKENNILEDVVIKAPIIKISKGFKGTFQAFATKKIALEEEVTLAYPSVLCIYNNSNEKSELTINRECSIYGAVILFGSPLEKIDDNEIVFSEKSKLIGDVFCSGKLMVKGSIFGSVYTNRFFSKTISGTYENCIIDAEIDITKRPNYFISIPLFKEKNEPYGVFKKVL